MKIFKYVLSVFILLYSFFSPLASYAAQSSSDFEMTSNIQIQYSYPQEYIKYMESYNIKVNNPSYYYRSGMEQTFLIQDYGIASDKLTERKYKKDSLKLTDGYGNDLKYSVKEGSDGLLVTTTINQRIDHSEDFTMKLEYLTHDLVSLNGNIANLYMPGLPKDTKFTENEGKYGLKVKYNYNAKIVTNADAPLPSFSRPTDIQVTKSKDSITYTIPAQDRIGQNPWLQLGEKQYYYFKIEQKAPKTDNITPEVVNKVTDLASSNIFKMALPREYDETKQNTLIKSISPKPYKIERDTEGNLYALFKVPANKSTIITIEGYITQEKPSISNQKALPDYSLSEYANKINDNQGIKKYLSADKYIEVNDPLVQSIAQELKNGPTSIQALIKKDYEYIVNKFSYSYEKLSNGNKRLGAKAALSGSQTICMEYADSLTAILRAQGLPARTAIGYGNDPTGAENKISNNEPTQQKIAHQWTQVWIPDYGWLSVDPTWGESGREYIGSDLDHILWYTIGSSGEDIADTTIFSADRWSNQNLFGEYKIYFQALKQDNYNNIQGIKEAKSLVDSFKNTPTYNVDFILRTSLFGRLLVYIIPAVVIIFIVTTVMLLGKAILRRSISKRSPSMN